MPSDNFYIDLENKFIPQLEEMLRKEIEHCAYLKKNPFSDSPIDFIKNSEFWIMHFKSRIEEYKIYLEDHKANLLNT